LRIAQPTVHFQSHRHREGSKRRMDQMQCLARYGVPTTTDCQSCSSKQSAPIRASSHRVLILQAPVPNAWGVSCAATTQNNSSVIVCQTRCVSNVCMLTRHCIRTCESVQYIDNLTHSYCSHSVTYMIVPTISIAMHGHSTRTNKGSTQ
jgi:hypothetical protein